MAKTDEKSPTSSRPGRRGNESKPANQQRHTAGSRDGTPALQQSRRGVKASQNLNKSQDGTQNGSTAAAQPQPQPEEPATLNGFNSSDVEAMMKKNFDLKAPLYKPDPKNPAPRAESPWGTKPGQMASGKDFWVELRKQVTSLQQSGGTSLGG